MPGQGLQVLDGLRSTQAGGLHAFKVGAHLACASFGIQDRELMQEKVRKGNDGPERVVDVVGHAARQNTERLQPLAGGQTFQLIPLVQTRSFQQFLVNLDAPQRHIELVAQNLIALGFWQTLEHRNPQTLGLEDQREYQQGASARFQTAFWRKQFLCRKCKRQGGLRLTIQHAEEGLQFFRAAIGKSRQECGLHARIRQGFEQ